MIVKKRKREWSRERVMKLIVRKRTRKRRKCIGRVMKVIMTKRRI